MDSIVSDDFGESQTQSSSFTQTQASSGSSDRAFNEHFLSMDDIKSLGQRVTCTFRENVIGLGFIDRSTESKDVQKGSKLDIPLFMAKVLQRRQLVTVELPKGYNDTYREILVADAKMLDLHRLGPHFYNFGKHLVEMDHKHSEEVAKSLATTFHERVRGLMDHSLNASKDTELESTKFQSTLDETEISIFETGQKYTQDFKRWEVRESKKTNANEMVANYEKRKRLKIKHITKAAGSATKKSLSNVSANNNSASLADATGISSSSHDAL